MTNDRKGIFSNRYEDTERPGQGFFKMMMVWHGSVFKLIWYQFKQQFLTVEKKLDRIEIRIVKRSSFLQTVVTINGS